MEFILDLDIDKKLFEILYEFEDIIEVEDTDEYCNMVDISVNGNETFLLANGIVSHNSASASISKIIGRENKGYFAMFGVPPNSYEMNLKDIIKSKKMIELKEILNISYDKDIQMNLSFKNIIIATDYDLPGHFICGQLLGLFYRFGKHLFEEQRIKRFVTPLIIAKNNDKIINWFYDFEDYFKYEKANSNKIKYEYKKGLGSWDKEELDYIISKDGMDKMTEVFVLDDNAELNIHNWLSSSTADERKAMLDGFSFNIMEM